MSRYIAKIKCEVLYEKLFRLLREYSVYMESTPTPSQHIIENYKLMGSYPNRIITCNTEKEYETLNSEVSRFEKELKKITG